MIDKLKMKLYLLFLRFIRKKEKVKGKLEYILNHLKDEPDNRDYDALQFVGVTQEIPDKAKLKISPQAFVKNQGSIGSCGSFAVCTAYEILSYLKGQKNPKVDLAELYHYFKVRKLNGKFPKDSGQTSRDMLKVAQNLGITAEKLWPYIVNDYNKEPDMFAESFAKFFKIKRYMRVYNLKTMRQYINKGYPVLIGSAINKSFFSKSGKIEIVNGEPLYGGHEYIVYGYDDQNKELLCINSWGKYYKLNGLMRLPYTYWDKYGYDMWTIEI